MYKKLELKQRSVSKEYTSDEIVTFVANFTLIDPESKQDEGMQSHGSVVYRYEYPAGTEMTEEEVLKLVANEPGVVTTY